MRAGLFTPRSRATALERIISIRHLRWLRVDWHVLLLAFALVGVGVLFIGSMSSTDELLERDGLGGVDLGAHLKKLLVALPALGIGLFLRPRWLRRNAPLLYGATILLLLLVPLVGEERNNARRWIAVPGIAFDLQPSELAKVGLVLALATALYTNRLRSFRDALRPLALAALPAGLVAFQPDLGTALTIVPVTLGMFYVAGAPARRLLGGFVLCLAAGWGAIQTGLLHDYQLQRIDTWMESFEPASLIEGKRGPAFHTYQSRVALGNGGLLGRGLGRGVANEAGHLPERDCDSIFAVIGEEAGFAGGIGLIGLYTLLVMSLLQAASRVRERFSRLVVAGVALTFASHFVINVGVNLGLVPMTGLNLPLVSTGGSSLLASLFGVGLAVGLASHQEPTLDQDAFRP